MGSVIRYPLGRLEGEGERRIDYETEDDGNEDPPPSDFGAASEGEKRAGLDG